MAKNSDRAGGSGGKPKKWWQWLLVYPSVAVAVVGAVPQYVNVFKGLAIGVHASEVAEAEQQNKLWQRNVECDLHLSDVTTRANVVVSVGACPTGDVQVNVKYTDGNRIIHWIAFEELQSANNGTLFPGVRSAVAAQAAPPGFELAESDVRVICQRWLDDGRLLRRVREGGHCYDEIINTYTGRVIQRKPADCEPSC